MIWTGLGLNEEFFRCTFRVYRLVKVGCGAVDVKMRC